MERSHQSIKKMCEDLEKANFARPEKYKKFLVFAKPIIEEVNTPPYKIDKTEAEFILKFYAKQSLMYLGVGKEIDIEVFNQKKMLHKFGRGNGKALPDGVRGVVAAASPSEGRIIYSEKLIDEIASGNPDDMYRAFRTIFHETKHIEQSYKREYSFSAYIMALETMAMHVDPYVYLNNYWGTYRECDAEKYGMEFAQSELPGLCRVIDKRNQRENWINFKDGLTGNKETVIGRVCGDNGSVMLPGSMYPAGERIKIMELIAEEYVKKYPKKAFEEHPVLRLAFKDNGKRKSINELLENMLSLVEDEQSLTKAQLIESVYLMIIANRFPYDYEKDRLEVYRFMRNHKMKFNFVEKLEDTMYRMSGQDFRKREIERDFMKYGVGMSRASKFRRREYFKKGTRKPGLIYAAQYYLEPGKADEMGSQSMMDKYKIDVPIVNNENVENQSSQVDENKKVQNESEESR